MSSENTERAAHPPETEVSPRLDPGGEPRSDDRNDELDESPAPDPDEPGDANDDPEAD